MTPFRTAALILFNCNLFFGAIYPGIVTGIGQALFPREAQGSLLTRDGTPVGSSLLAQKFTSPKYFFSRPSAADYGTLASGASNLGPASQALFDAVEARRKALGGGAVPVDLLTASGSGLDPHLSLAAVLFQVPRVAQERGLDGVKAKALKELAIAHLERPQFGLFGQDRINVLELNLAVDAAFPKP